MSTDRRMDKDEVYIYPMTYYWVKKKRNKAICSNTDGPKEYHTKWSQKEKDKYCVTYIQNLKHNTNGFIYKTETAL